MVHEAVCGRSEKVTSHFQRCCQFPHDLPRKMLFISLLLYLNTSSFTYQLDLSLFQPNQNGIVQSSTVYSFVTLALIQSTSWL